MSSDEYGPRMRYLPDEEDEAEAPSGRGIDNGMDLRPRGRQVPARARKIVQIVVEDVVLGEVDAKELTAGAQFDLEDCNSAYDLVNWLVTYAGGSKEQAVAALRPMKAQALVDLLLEISTALGQAIDVPKRRARR